MKDASDFLKALADALKATGLDARYDSYYMVVAGCRFEAETKRAKPGIRPQIVKFLGSNFREDVNGDFNLVKAAGKVIAALPEQLKVKAKNAAALQHKKLCDDLVKKLNAKELPGAVAYRRWYQVDERTFIGSSDEGVEVKVLCQTEADVEKVLHG